MMEIMVFAIIVALATAMWRIAALERAVDDLRERQVDVATRRLLDTEGSG